MVTDLDAALARAEDDIAVCCGTPRGCLCCWCEPVAGWIGAVKALRAALPFLATHDSRAWSMAQEALAVFVAAFPGVPRG